MAEGSNITDKTLKSVLNGTEEIPLNDSGSDRKTTTQAIADLGGGGGASKSTELSDMPDQTAFDAATVGSKLVKKDANGYGFAASTTISGFNDKTAQTLSFNDATRTLTITPTATNYLITTSDGTQYTKTAESIQITDANGLHGVYYNDTTGALETFTGENRSQIYDRMKSSIVVSYIEWSVTDQEHQFYTKVIKGRDMNNTTWAKNAFDSEIYVLNGLVLFDDPSSGGTVTPSGDLDVDAQFGLSAGAALWTDDSHDLPLKSTGDDWTVYYKWGTDEIRNILKTSFAFLTDVDVGIGVTGRLVFNNDGTFETVTNNDFMYHLVGISNGVEEIHRVVSFMGQNDYPTVVNARNNRDVEIAAIDSSFGIRQEFETVYAILVQTRDTYTNAVKARIIEISVIQREGTSTVIDSNVPPDLINGSDASYLHTHDSIYGNSNVYDFSFALSDETSDLTTDNDAEIEVIRNQTIESITFSVNTAPVGSSILVDVFINGTNILTSPITLVSGSTSVTIVNPQIDDISLSAGNIIKADITQIGATTAGAGAKIYFKTIL